MRLREQFEKETGVDSEFKNGCEECWQYLQWLETKLKTERAKTLAIIEGIFVKEFNDIDGLVNEAFTDDEKMKFRFVAKKITTKLIEALSKEWKNG